MSDELDPEIAALLASADGNVAETRYDMKAAELKLKAKEDYEKEKVETRKEYTNYDVVEREGYKRDTWVIEEKNNYFMLHTVLQIRLAHLK